MSSKFKRRTFAGTAGRVAGQQMRSAQARAANFSSVRGAFMARGVPRPSFWAGPGLGNPNTEERKTIDLAPAAYVADTTGTVTLLNGVATGDDFTDRDGRRINMKSLFITGRISPIDSNTLDTISRLIVVYDKQSNGAAPVITDVLKTANSVDQLNLNNRARFQVLVDKRFFIGRVDNTATQSFSVAPGGHMIKIFRKLNLETQFSGTTAAVASIATGSLYMITVGDGAAGLGGNFSLSTRVRFTEKA